MNEELLIFIEEKLEATGIRHYDFWNDQITTLKKEDPFHVPAVFLEIMPYETQNLGRKRIAAEITFTLHHVFQQYERTRRSSRRRNEAVQKRTGMEDIIAALKGKNNGSTIGSISVGTVIPDHRWEGYIDQRQQFKVRMYSDAAVRPTIPVPEGTKTRVKKINGTDTVFA